jgi:hypothetical protein
MKRFTEYITERYKETEKYTKNSFGWDVPDRTFVDDVFDQLVQIICDVNGISEKNFKDWDNTTKYVKGYFDNNQEILLDIDKFNGRRKEFCAEYLYDKHFNNKNKDEINLNIVSDLNKTGFN